ncbi:MAG: amidohydrolase, partial [Terriglobia bacterium]
MKRFFVGWVPLLVAATLIVASGAGGAQQNGGVDLVLTNGNIYTVDPGLGRVEALAITEGKIVAAGTAAEIN